MRRRCWNLLSAATLGAQGLVGDLQSGLRYDAYRHIARGDSSMRSSSSRITILATVFAVAGMLVSLPADSSADDLTWLLAAGAAARPDYEGSDELELFPLGSFRASYGSGEYLELTGARSSGSAVRLLVNLVDSSQFDMLEFGLLLQYRLERDDVENDAVEALGKVSSAIEAGTFFAYKADPFKLSVSLAKDVSNEHDGVLIELAADHKTQLSDTFQLTTGISSTYASNDYMNSYFRVTTAGAIASGLSEYDPDAGFKDVGLRLTTVWAGPGSGWEHVRIMGMFSLFRMLGDAADSPIVDDEGDDTQLFGGIAVGWQS